MGIWISAAITLGTYLIAFIIAFTYLRFEVADLKNKNSENTLNYSTAIKELKALIENSTNEFKHAITLLQVSSAEQVIINKYTAAILANLADRVEKTEKTKLK